MSWPKHRNDLSKFPTGWVNIKDKFIGLCLYLGTPNGGTMCSCNFPLNTSTRENPNTKWSFMCGKIMYEIVPTKSPSRAPTTTPSMNPTGNCSSVSQIAHPLPSFFV